MKDLLTRSCTLYRTPPNVSGRISKVGDVLGQGIDITSGELCGYHVTGTVRSSTDAVRASSDRMGSEILQTQSSITKSYKRHFSAGASAKFCGYGIGASGLYKRIRDLKEEKNTLYWVMYHIITLNKHYKLRDPRIKDGMIDFNLDTHGGGFISGCHMSAVWLSIVTIKNSSIAASDRSKKALCIELQAHMADLKTSGRSDRAVKKFESVSSINCQYAINGVDIPSKAAVNVPEMLEVYKLFLRSANTAKSTSFAFPVNCSPWSEVGIDIERQISKIYSDHFSQIQWLIPKRFDNSLAVSERINLVKGHEQISEEGKLELYKSIYTALLNNSKITQHYFYLAYTIMDTLDRSSGSSFARLIPNSFVRKFLLNKQPFYIAASTVSKRYLYKRSDNRRVVAEEEKGGKKKQQWLAQPFALKSDERGNGFYFRFFNVSEGGCLTTCLGGRGNKEVLVISDEYSPKNKNQLWKLQYHNHKSNHSISFWQGIECIRHKEDKYSLRMFNSGRVSGSAARWTIEFT